MLDLARRSLSPGSRVDERFRAGCGLVGVNFHPNTSTAEIVMESKSKDRHL